MRLADLSSPRRNAALKVFAGLIVLFSLGMGMSAPSAQAWVAPAALDADL